jgi:5'-3' exoribonuclease 2
VNVVREYLELEFRDLDIKFKYDFEKIIDDFVFLCFFVGNDFIPHLPSLKIREGAIDALIYLYKKVIVTLDGYLTEDNGKINLSRTEKLLEKLALVEEEIFKRQLIAKNKELYYKSQDVNKDQVKDEVMRQFLEIKTPRKEVELSNKEELQLFDDIEDYIEKVIDEVENKDSN